jgi:hypothetical protein
MSALACGHSRLLPCLLHGSCVLCFKVPRESWSGHPGRVVCSWQHDVRTNAPWFLPTFLILSYSNSDYFILFWEKIFMISCFLHFIVGWNWKQSVIQRHVQCLLWGLIAQKQTKLVAQTIRINFSHDQLWGSSALAWSYSWGCIQVEGWLSWKIR